MRHIAWPAGVILTLTVSSPVCADFYHYADIIVGDQAASMGGAYGAIADDSSAIYYNPAGLAQVRADAVSASMNAYHGARTLVKDLFEEDYHRRSGQLVPVFLGGTSQTILPTGWTAGYGIFVPDSQSVSRDETIHDDALNKIDRWHHMLKTEETATYIGAAAGRQFGDTSVGFGMNIIQFDRLFLQTINGRYGPFSGEGADPAIFFNQFTTTREELTVLALEPTLGTIQSVGDWRFAVSGRQALIVDQRSKVSVDNYELITSADNDEPTGDDSFNRAEDVMTKDHPLRSWPGNLRFGVARRTFGWDLAADLTYFGAAQKPNVVYRRHPVLKLALGARTAGGVNTHAFGVFTNADARPEVTKDSASGSEHVSFLGMTYGVSHSPDPKTRYSLSLMVQLGKGLGQFDGRPGREPQEILTQAFGIGGAIATGS